MKARNEGIYTRGWCFLGCLSKGEDREIYRERGDSNTAKCSDLISLLVRISRQHQISIMVNAGRAPGPIRALSAVIPPLSSCPGARWLTRFHLYRIKSVLGKSWIFQNFGTLLRKLNRQSIPLDQRELEGYQHTSDSRNSLIIKYEPYAIQ